MFSIFGMPAVSIVLFALYIQDKKAFLQPLSKNEEAEYLKRIDAGDEIAKNELIEHNLRLVAHIAKKYCANPAQADELISIGTIGLIKAANSFKLSKDFRFSTYASKCVANEILMHFRSAKKNSSDISIYDPVETEKSNQISIIDTLMAPENVTAEAEFNIDSQKLYKCIQQLDDRSREIIVLRYGLCGGSPLTQQQIAKKIGISRSYISRLETKAIENLRAMFNTDD